jgi:AraC-like DNA-binding protein
LTIPQGALEHSLTSAMSQPNFTLPVQYLREIAEQVRALQGDVAIWLLAGGLTLSQLEDSSLEVPFETFEKLVSSALTFTHEPALGLLVGQRLQMSMHGALGYAAASSGSIRQALGLFESFSRLRFSPVAVSSEHRPLDVRVLFTETQPLGAIRRPVLEALIMASKNMLDTITLDACRIGTVAFPFEAPPYAELARQLFGCELRYRASWAGFTLPPSVLDVPLRTADPEAFRQAVSICQRELERLGQNTTFSGRVRRLLLEHQSRFPSLAVTARLLHETPRTLHRRLLAEGTSFHDLLEDVRHTLAVEHLNGGQVSIEELAYTLGYTDVSNFRRAFKRWEGLTPTDYRSRHLSKPARPDGVTSGRRQPVRVRSRRR